MRVIVTGASGFIGRNLVKAVPGSWDTVALYRSSENFSEFVKEVCPANVQAMRCDLEVSQSVDKLASQIGETFDVCVYLAGNGDPVRSDREPLIDLQQNGLALVTFLERFHFKKFIYFSSGAVYDGTRGLVSPATPVLPKLPYSITKLASEGYIRFFTQSRDSIDQYVILRFFGCYGPHEPPRKIYTKLVTAFALQGKREFTVYGDGKNLIDAMYVDDTIRGIFQIIEHEQANLMVDFCTGNPLSIDELVQRAAEAFGISDVVIRHQGNVPEHITFWVSPNDQQRLFDFVPKVTLEDGLHRLADFLRNKRFTQ